MTTLELTNVRYYDSSDVYHYSVDNRPLFDLSSRDDLVIDKYVPIVSISNPPEFLGQIAIVNRAAYMGIGTESTNDWVKVTI